MPNELNSQTSAKPKVGVLIADADNNKRAFFNTALTKAGGFEVWTAATAKDALDSLAKIEPGKLSFIVFDITQKEIDGPVLLQKIRSNPAYIGIGILICSDKLSQDDRFLIQEMGVKYFLSRSVGTDDFVAMSNLIERENREKRPLLTLTRDLETALLSEDAEKCNELIANPIIANSPNKEEVIPLQAEVMLVNHEVEKAIETLQEYLQHQAKSGKPETFRALSIFGKALCMANKFDEALGIFQRLSEKSPTNLTHKLSVGEALLGKGDLAGAEKNFQDVLKADPENTKAKVGMGGVHLASGNSAQAISLLEKINGSVESHALASYFNNAAIALTRKGQSGEAISLYTNALKFFEKHKGTIYFNMGMAQLRNGKVNAACECFDYVLKLEKKTFVDKKAILREYQQFGLDHMIKKYAGFKE